MAWTEYPVQTPTGNYINARYDPATGEVQVQNYSSSGAPSGDWRSIGNADLGTFNDRYGSQSYGWVMPSRQQTWTMKLAQQQQGALSPSPAAAPPASSYFGQAPTISMGGAPIPVGGASSATGGSGGSSSTMNWQQVGQSIGLSQRDIDAFTQQGWSPDEVYQSFKSGAGPPTGTPASRQAAAPTPQIGATTQPESVALRQMAQIDPTGEALRQGLGQSYLTNLGGGPATPQFGGMPQFGLDLSRGAAAPAAGDVQSYLDLYKQIDPQGYAQRVALAGGIDQFVQQAQAQAALGSQLDPGTIREVEQGTRRAQIGRGNVYGTPQLVQEAMERGSAGEARLQQRRAALQSALGQQQSYLGAGLGLGDIANTLYQQGYGRYLQGYQTQANAALQGYGAQLQGWQAQQNARLQGQQGALSYLGSGQTPYQAGAGYLATAENRAGMAAQGGPQYAPQGPSPYYTGAGTSSFPQYGIDTSQTAANWYNLMNAYNQPGAAQRNRTGSALAGAGSGALSGAAAGAPLAGATYGLSIPIGAAIGGIAGGAGGYFS